MKKPKQLVCAAFLFTSAFEGFSQQATVAAGGDGSSSAGSVSFSVGQPVYAPMTSASGTVLQGVQIPYEFLVIGVDEFPGIQLEMSAFPNPTRSVINLRMDTGFQQDMNYQLFNAAGQLITNAQIVNAVTEIPRQELAAGNYTLRVLYSQSAVKSFSIIKTN